MEFLSTADEEHPSASNISESPSASQKYVDFQACKVCLTTNNENEVFLLQKYNLTEIFGEVTGVPVYLDDGTPQHICRPCGLELQKFAAFRERCQRVNTFIQEVQFKIPVLTSEHIQALDRTKYQEPLTFNDLLSQPEPAKDTDTNFKINVKEEIKPDQYTLDSPSHISDDDTILKTILEAEFDLNADLKAEDDYSLQTIKDSMIHVNKHKKIKDKKHKSKKIKLQDYIDFDTELAEYQTPKKKRLYNQKTEEDFEAFSKIYNVEVVFLTNEQKINEVLSRKDSEEYANSRFQCEQCYKSFMKDSAYKKHMKSHDPSTGNHVCEICFVRFSTRPKLMKHLRRHRAHFICKICNNISKETSMAKKHFQWHEGFKYVCKHCSKNFSVYSSYLNHIRENHTPVRCKTCGESVDGTRKLAEHTSDVHIGSYKCLSCNARFHNSDALGRHTNVTNGHACDLQRSCPQCGEGFMSTEQLNAHLELAHKGVIYRCDLCNATYVSDRQLGIHWKRAHTAGQRKRTDKQSQDGDYMCEVCAKSYPNETTLRYHQRIHTGEKPYQCPMCPKRFRMKTNLQVHINTHTGARPYKCPLCPEAFKSYSQKHKHRLLVHTKERPHKCHMCEKTYVVKCDLTSHIRTVHMKLPYPPRNRRRRQIVE